MLPGHIPAITRLLRGQYAEIAGRLPGNCSANARYCPDDSPAAARMNSGNCACIPGGQPADSVRIAGVSAGLILIRGWCLTKMTGFPIPESRPRFCSIERSKLTH